MPSLSPPLASEWTIIPSGLQLASDLVPPSVDLTPATTVVLQWTTHGLSCLWSEGRHHRHAAINDILHRALSSAKVPSRLEPSGLYRSDGKCPDGITIMPWKMASFWCGMPPAPILMHPLTLPLLPVKLVLWRPKRRRGSVASIAIWSPATLLRQWPLRPQVPSGLEPLEFLRELGRCLRQVTGEVKSTTYLLQRLSVAIQRGNAASVLGTISHSADLENFL